MGQGASAPRPPQVHAASNKTEFGSSKTGFYSMARECRRGTHPLKAPSSQREESGGLLRGKMQLHHQKLGKRAETSRNSQGMRSPSGSLAFHWARIAPSRVQIPALGRDLGTIVKQR